MYSRETRDGQLTYHQLLDLARDLGTKVHIGQSAHERASFLQEAGYDAASFSCLNGSRKQFARELVTKAQHTCRAKELQSFVESKLISQTIDGSLPSRKPGLSPEALRIYESFRLLPEPERKAFVAQVLRDLAKALS